MSSFIERLPKAELHLHIEGTLEPEMMFEIARRNKLDLRFDSPEEARKAYQFTDLQSFLDIYYEATRVLLHEKDFYDLTLAYLEKASDQNVKHTEIFFDPQAHTGRGVEMATVFRGIHQINENFRAVQQAFDLTETELQLLARNSIDASFAKPSLGAGASL